MLRKAMLGLLLMAAWQAQAEYQCPVKPQDDIIIAPQTVQVIGQSGTLTITPAGEVQRDGTPVNNPEFIRE